MRRPVAIAAGAMVALVLPAPSAPPSEEQGTAGTLPPPHRVPATTSSEVVPPVIADVRPRTPVPTSSLDTALETVSSGGVTPAEAVRRCESDGIYTAENPVSSASGAYQFISSTWTAVTGLEPPAAAYPAEVQDAAFHKLWDDGSGAHHWNPSRPCWAALIGDAA